MQHRRSPTGSMSQSVRVSLHAPQRCTGAANTRPQTYMLNAGGVWPLNDEVLTWIQFCEAAIEQQSDAKMTNRRKTLKTFVKLENDLAICLSLEHIL